MTPERFWELVATLGGVADDGTTPALDAALRASGEGEDFGDRVDEHVQRLLQRCSLPFSHQGDGGEWVAAAVIAAGRETYEHTLAAGGLLSPDDWQWAEAENLLVAGFSGEDDAAGEESEPGWEGVELGLALEWKTAQLPDGLWTTDVPDTDAFGDREHWGRFSTIDPAWTEAVRRVDADAEFQRRRASIEFVSLHVKVVDSDGVELVYWPNEDLVMQAAICLPREMLDDPDQRPDRYVDALVELVVAVQERLGRA